MKHLTPRQQNMIDRYKHSLTKKHLITRVQKLLDNTVSLTKAFSEGDLTGWEMVKEQPHPFIFELGHITLFYMHHFMRHNFEFTVPPDLYVMFDSLRNPPPSRSTSTFFSVTDQIKIYKNTMETVLRGIKRTRGERCTPFFTYSLLTALLHNEMHNEVTLFLIDMIGHKSPISRIFIPVREANVSNPFIQIREGTFTQGLQLNDRLRTWDNEMPQHTTTVKSFYCQKYPVTNREFIEFIKAGGYSNETLWSAAGWQWVRREKPQMPKFWVKRDGKYYRKHFDHVISISDEPDHPVVKVNYYEAEAYATYCKGRLPTESEYEYMATNEGTTRYPWGNQSRDIEVFANVNYTQGDVMPIKYYEQGYNQDGIYGLMGDCWYWTSTRFHPYDGYKIDPLYDTFSYPFFYERYVVKGAAWTCGEDLAYPQYRNAQEPEKRFHYTGIRVVMDMIPE